MRVAGERRRFLSWGNEMGKGMRALSAPTFRVSLAAGRGRPLSLSERLPGSQAAVDWWVDSGGILPNG